LVAADTLLRNDGGQEFEMNGLDFSTILIPLAIFSFAYIALFIYVINYYLPRIHPATWAGLGRPLFQQPLFRPDDTAEDMRKWSLTTKFLLVTSDYTMLKDPLLTKLIWSIRMLLAALLVLWGAMLLRIFLLAR
jgi:hypothetical protein